MVFKNYLRNQKKGLSNMSIFLLRKDRKGNIAMHILAANTDTQYLHTQTPCMKAITMSNPAKT